MRNYRLNKKDDPDFKERQRNNVKRCRERHPGRYHNPYVVRVPMICAECGKEFVPTYRTQKPFCSKNCYRRKYYRDRYRNDPKFREFMLNAVGIFTKKKRAKRLSELRSKLGNKCMKCGYTGGALVFHHLTNEKDALYWYQSKNLERLVDEGIIQLLCSNCHIEHHLLVGNHFYLPPSK